MSDLISREAVLSFLDEALQWKDRTEGGPFTHYRPMTRDEVLSAIRALPPAQEAAPAVKVKPPIPAEGHDIREMIANLSAHPEWPAMRNAGDVKLYFINEGDAHAIRFAALEWGAA